MAPGHGRVLDSVIGCSHSVLDRAQAGPVALLTALGRASHRASALLHHANRGRPAETSTSRSAVLTLGTCSEGLPQRASVRRAATLARSLPCRPIWISMTCQELKPSACLRRTLPTSRRMLITEWNIGTTGA